MLRRQVAPSTPKNADTIIGRSIILENVAIKGLGSIHIEGTVSGQVDIEGQLTIGSEGKFEGNIKAASVTISGNFQGEAIISDDLHITSQAHVVGRIQAGKMAVDSGASIALT